MTERMSEYFVSVFNPTREPKCNSKWVSIPVQSLKTFFYSGAAAWLADIGWRLLNRGENFVPAVYLGGGALSSALAGISAHHFLNLWTTGPAEEQPQKESEPLPMERELTPLHKELQKKDLDLFAIKRLLEKKPNLLAKDQAGYPPVFYAAKACHPRITELLLSNYPELLPVAWQGWLEREVRDAPEALSTAQSLLLCNNPYLKEKKNTPLLPETLEKAEEEITCLYKNYKTTTAWQALLSLEEIKKEDWIERVRKEDPQQTGDFLSYAIYCRRADKIAGLLEEPAYAVKDKHVQNAKSLKLSVETINALASKITLI